MIAASSLLGWAGAFLNRQGYYSANMVSAKKFMTEDEWGYWIEGKPAKVEIKDPQQVTMKNGRPAIQGTCPDCGTKIFKIGKLS